MYNCYDKFETFLDTLKKTDASKIFSQNISFTEFMQLKIVRYFVSKSEREVVAVSELVGNSCVTAQAISKCLRILEKKGFIERNPNSKDRRITEVALTDEGVRVYEITKDELNSVMSEVFSEFTDKERQDFEILSDKFLNLYSAAIDRRL